MVVVRDKECSLVPVLKMNSLKVTSSYPSVEVLHQADPDQAKYSGVCFD